LSQIINYISIRYSRYRWSNLWDIPSCPINISSRDHRALTWCRLNHWFGNQQGQMFLNIFGQLRENLGKVGLAHICSDCNKCWCQHFPYSVFPSSYIKDTWSDVRLPLIAETSWMSKAPAGERVEWWWDKMRLPNWTVIYVLVEKLYLIRHSRLAIHSQLVLIQLVMIQLIMSQLVMEPTDNVNVNDVLTFKT